MNAETQPTLTTERLILRPFQPEHAPVVQRFAGDRAAADSTERITYSYVDGMAEVWITSHAQQSRDLKQCTFAVVLKDGQQVTSAVGLTLTMAHARGELGYWIGRVMAKLGMQHEQRLRLDTRKWDLFEDVGARDKSGG